MDVKNLITKLHYQKNPEGMLFWALRLASVFYGIGAELKNELYKYKIVQPKKVSAKVVSVGNLTTGGVGKTPVVGEIAKYLKSKGQRVAIVSRGYGGKLSNKNINVISDGETIYYGASMAGDEPYWLAKETGCVVVTSRSRYRASKYAIEKFNVDIILLDDGFQHRKLYRDVDIVLIDSVKQFGNKCQLPAGPLRESVKALDRADSIVVVSKSTDHTEAQNFVDNLEKMYNKPAFLCKIEPDEFYNIKNNTSLAKGSRAAAVCAIGQPEQFFAFLSDFDIVKKITFDDHHIYTFDELSQISENIITTEKDAVKMKDFNFENIYALRLKTKIDVEKIIK